jgi:hypothetical protein
LKEKVFAGKKLLTNASKYYISNNQLDVLAQINIKIDYRYSASGLIHFSDVDVVKADSLIQDHISNICTHELKLHVDNMLFNRTNITQLGSHNLPVELYHYKNNSIFTYSYGEFLYHNIKYNKGIRQCTH